MISQGPAATATLLSFLCHFFFLVLFFVLCLPRTGAEARLYECLFMERRCVVKERFVKAYRHPSLDAQISTQRTLAEARLLSKLRRARVRTPTVYHVDVPRRRIYMELVAGISLKQFIVAHDAEPAALVDVAQQFAALVARVHNSDAVHGDLTTSNVLVQHDAAGGAPTLVLIDLGLGYSTTLTEDKAVDLYVLSRALESTHSTHEQLLFPTLLRHYVTLATNGAEIASKYDAVQQRGRKKSRRFAAAVGTRADQRRVGAVAFG